MTSLTINGTSVTVPEGATLLQAAKKLGIRIPTLCNFEMDPLGVHHRLGSCRVCMVEVEGRPNLAPACSTPVMEGMRVHTSTMRVFNGRRTVLDLLLSNHPKDCLTCHKNLSCELQALAQEMGLTHVKYDGERATHSIDRANESIVRDMNKCIYCRRCEMACTEVQTVGILAGVGRGFRATVAPTCNKPLDETKCTFCGQCVAVCPVGALAEVDRTYDVWIALNDRSKTVVVQTAPAVRVALGEELGLPPGTSVTGKMVTALRMLGFKAVFDTDFAADLTIMEEAHELCERVKKNENLPILTSCCPGWVKFFEHQFPDLLHVPSTAKSPQQMMGAVAKAWYAKKIGVDPKDLVMVSVMPCLAKKYEAAREEFAPGGVRDVDVVISTRELARMIKEAGIQFASLRNAAFDHPLGESTGAAVIFGASGGVLEAALRTAGETLTGAPLENVDFEAVRGLSGVREATIRVGDLELRAAVASGLGNARKLLGEIRAGRAKYHAIEIMACPGGCLNGGGQPFIHGDTQILEKRRLALYDEDFAKARRRSHENPSIQRLYAEFLGEPGGERAHELLHTHYTARANI
jgi:NADH-quinone oxidoreductase subunit G